MIIKTITAALTIVLTNQYIDIFGLKVSMLASSVMDYRF
jgi:hypothetical protein